MGGGTVTKDSVYYEDRLRDKWNAHAIIKQLLDAPNPSAPSVIYQVNWIDRVPRDDAQPRLQATREELLKRLHWISSEAFGENLNEWRSWLSAFETNTPLPYSR